MLPSLSHTGRELTTSGGKKGKKRKEKQQQQKENTTCECEECEGLYPKELLLLEFFFFLSYHYSHLTSKEAQYLEVSPIRKLITFSFHVLLSICILEFLDKIFKEGHLNSGIVKQSSHY